MSTAHGTPRTSPRDVLHEQPIDEAATATARDNEVHLSRAREVKDLARWFSLELHAFHRDAWRRAKFRFHPLKARRDTFLEEWHPCEKMRGYLRWQRRNVHHMDH